MTYDSSFFEAQQGTVRSARKLLPLVFELLEPERIVDVGCGIGAWAKVAKELGGLVTVLDGSWVPRDRLLIDNREFRAVDLSNPQPLPEKFDLAICLEVAEHLPRECAKRFVEFLTSLSPAILFSAAV